MEFNANLRNVKLADGINTIKIASEKKVEQWLCEMCGELKTCKVKKCMDKLFDTIEAPVRSCKSFVPLIGFNPPHKGFDRPFNTIRLGPAWSRRVYKGQRVALYCTEESKIFGYGEIVDVKEASTEEMMKKHAKFNHIWGDTNRKRSAGEDMLKKLINMYGPNYVKRSDSFSVIYIKPD